MRAIISRLLAARAANAASTATASAGPNITPLMGRSVARAGKWAAQALIAGSFAGLGWEIYKDVFSCGPHVHRAALDAGVASGQLARVGGDSDAAAEHVLYIRDSRAGDAGQSADSKVLNVSDTVTVLIAAGSLTLAAPLHDAVLAALARAGCRDTGSDSDTASPNFRVISYEVARDDSTSAGPVASFGDLADPVAAHSAAMSRVVNACAVAGPVVVLAANLEWLAALRFARRNAADVAGLLLVDPWLPPATPSVAVSAAAVAAGGGGAGLVLLSQPPQARAVRGSASDGTVVAALAGSVESAASVPAGFADAVTRQRRCPLLRLVPAEPLHLLEHLVAGHSHTHLFAVPPPLGPTARAAVAAAGADPKRVESGELSISRRWVHARAADTEDRRHGLPRAQAGAPAAQMRDSVSRSPAEPAAAALADTLSSDAMLLERVYRNAVHAPDRPVGVADMLPSFAQSIAPSLARSMTRAMAAEAALVVDCAAAGPGNARQEHAAAAARGAHAVKSGTRVGLLPLLAAVARVPHDSTIADLDAYVAALAAQLPPEAPAAWLRELQAAAVELPALSVRVTQPPEGAALADARWDSREAALMLPSEVEVDARVRLAEHAAARLAVWQALLPRRVAPVPCAAPATRCDVFDPDAEAIAMSAARLACAAWGRQQDAEMGPRGGRPASPALV
jgi:hypothetical protein